MVMAVEASESMRPNPIKKFASQLLKCCFSPAFSPTSHAFFLRCNRGNL